jgi:hypothetical protein
VLTVIVKIFAITGGLCSMLTVIATIMPITGKSVCSVNSYCDNNWEVYMQCKQLL